MRGRLQVGGLVAAVTVLGVSATAWACEGVGGSVSPGSARAGDPITYSISGLDNGASYEVSSGGRVVDIGVSDGSSVSGSFPMPDLGDQPETLYVELIADHTEDTFRFKNSYPVQYLPPPAAATPTPSEAQQVSPAAPAGPKVKEAGKSRLSAATDEAASENRRSPGTGAASGGTPAVPVGSEPKTGVAGKTGVAESGAAAESTEDAESVPDRVLDTVGSTTSVGPAEIPTVGLLFMALVFVAGTGLAAFAICLLQTRRPDPWAAIRSPAPLGPDPVEVELQEMIAEDMARKLLTDLGIGERPISSRRW